VIAYVSYLSRYLDPADILAEMLFGLIMALTITLGAGVIAGGEGAQASGVLLGALGCNLAWAIIDAVFYVMGCRYDRFRNARLLDAIRDAPDEAAGLSLARQFIEPRISTIGRPEDRERLIRDLRLAASHTAVKPVGVTREELRGAFTIFLIVSTCALPAAIPFLLVNDPLVALRLSNLVLVGLLFVVGFHWSRELGGNGWRTGAISLVLGLTLVGIAIALGG